MVVKRSVYLAELIILLLAGRSVAASDVRTFDARDLSGTFVTAIEKVAPAVVGIHGERKLDPVELEKINSIFKNLPKEYRDLLGRRPDFQEWQGSGVLIRSDGLILTNNHVLEEAEILTISLSDGREFIGEVTGRDPYTDVALVKIKDSPSDLPTAVLGDSDQVRVGEWVLAIGSPFGLAGSVSQGIISAKHRTNDDVPIGQENYFFYKDFFQTTAAINVGNSGGPLINLDGEVIGINNSIQTAGVQANLGIGFAVPSNMAKFIVNGLMEKGRVVRGWLGVEIDNLQETDPDLWGTLRGVLVTDVIPNTPAERGGVERGDVIVGFNHTEVTSRNHLQNLVTQTDVGAPVLLSVLRNKEKLPLNVIIEEIPGHLLPGSREQEEILLGFTAEELS
ncbi:MAG: trypsin-like peptidase domain-containing protein, partial [bacterium]